MRMPKLVEYNIQKQLLFSIDRGDGKVDVYSINYLRENSIGNNLERLTISINGRNLSITNKFDVIEVSPTDAEIIKKMDSEEKEMYEKVLPSEINNLLKKLF